MQITNVKYKHGLTGTRIYRIWMGMRGRCNNPNNCEYHNYGGRNIKVCPEWDDAKEFADWAFSHGYADNLTLDRKNNDGNYEPNNCKWSTNIEQGSNTRKTVHLTINGITDSIAGWSRRTGIDAKVINWRYSSLGYRDERLIDKNNRHYKSGMLLKGCVNNGK